MQSGLKITEDFSIKIVDQVWYADSFLELYQIEFIQYIAKQTFCLYHNSLNLFFPRNLKEKIEKQKVKLESEAKTYIYKNDFVLSEAQRKTFEEIQKIENKSLLLYGIT